MSHAIYMRTDQAPFNDVRVRRAISHAVNRQEIIDAVWIRGEPIPAVSRGLAEWSPRIDELGAGARYYQYDPKEARRLLAEAGVPKGFKTLLHTTNGTGAGPAMVDAAQLAQRSLKEVGIETELKIEEYGAYMATTYLGKTGQGVTGLIHGDMSQFLLQLGGATLCAVYAFGVTFVVFKVVNGIRSMRVSEATERDGLDMPEFGMLAYPEDEGLPAA